MHAWTEGDFDSNGVNVHFYRTGQGQKPPLVLAHGLTDNGLCWTRTARVLEADFDVVMVDARNHGRSGRGPAGLNALAGDMARLVSHLGFDQPAAMGHSVGASVVAGLAALHPALVSRIVLEDPPWTAEPRGHDDQQIRQLSNIKTVEGLLQSRQPRVIGKVQDFFNGPGFNRGKLRPAGIIAALGIVHPFGKFYGLEPDTIICQPVGNGIAIKLFVNEFGGFFKHIRRTHPLVGIAEI